jgi:hypothetical protein
MSMDDPFKEIRQKAETHLRWAYTNNHLTIGELEDRLSRLYNTDSLSELTGLTEGLPPLPGSENRKTGETYQWERDRYDNLPKERKKSLSLMAFMSGNGRKGQWAAPREINAFALMGGIELDFRQASFPRETLSINCLAVMGGMTILVPPGVTVSSSVFPLMGGCENKTEGDGEGPHINVRGLALMGGVEIKTKK